MGFIRSLRNLVNVLRGNRMFVVSQTIVVYASSAQRLNSECSSSSCSQMQSGWMFSMDGQYHWYCLVNRLTSALSYVSSVVSMTVLVVLSILSFPCARLVVSMVFLVVSSTPSSACLERCETSKDFTVFSNPSFRSDHCAIKFVAQPVIF